MHGRPRQRSLPCMTRPKSKIPTECDRPDGASAAAAGRSRTEDRLWQAVEQRDRSLDGVFVYAVRSTGVFCRPSCPSRRPRRDRVVFFGCPDDAAHAGFRPCRRCRPELPHTADPALAPILAACRFIAAAEELPTLARVARHAGLAPHHFHRLFTARLGITPKQYGEALRRQRLQAGLPGAASVTGALMEAGFAASSSFYGRAKDDLGMPPSNYRRGAPSLDVEYAVAECSLGYVLAARTSIGLCSILLADGHAELVSALRARFSKARLTPASADFAEAMSAVVAIVEQPWRTLELPLDIRGTLFQQRVWQALRAIAPGETSTYAALAARIGAPSAVRAVAGACAANPLAVAIPCHRVVGSDGRLTGYRWGVDRKRALLGREVDESFRKHPRKRRDKTDGGG